jgi:hypothetical protein
MTPATHNPKPGVIRRDAVRIVAQPAMVDCGSVADGKHSHALTVLPLLDGERIAGFEVRCGCGATTVIECVYAEEN